MNEDENVNFVDTSSDKENGQTKCPQCGATDISLNTKTGKLRCNFCRHEFEPEKLETMEQNVENLQGKIIGTGAQNIDREFKDVVTLKCTSCGAEVVIDTAEATHARCHWCRNTLSINEKVPNGAVPDVVLPFKTNKKEAQTYIEKYVGKRKFFAHPKFKEEFTTDNIMGVYLPYMVVDMNAHSRLSGEGEIETRCYTVGSDDKKETFYDADLYGVEREFDITIEGLTVESSADKLQDNSNKTNNIINAIMPFDTENSVKWDANYLKGYSSEKRDTNIEQLEGWTKAQAKDIARYKANDSIKQYDRGVCWQSEEFDVKGEQWKAAYLPVWLYSYQEVKNSGKKMLHYVAVNARTNETVGSVPIHMPKLLAISAIIEIIGVILGTMILKESDGEGFGTIIALAGFLCGIIYYFVMYGRYRNKGARHHHESETKANISNLSKSDRFIRSRTRLRNSTMSGANNHRITNRKNFIR